MQLRKVTQVKSVICMRPPSTKIEDRCSEAAEVKANSVGQVSSDRAKEETTWEPEIKLDETHYTPDQVSMIRQMLQEECSSFARDENDLGCAPDLELDIKLNDDTPVRQAYWSVPPPLYQEVKDYNLEMVNKGFIKKSTSS